MGESDRKINLLIITQKVDSSDAILGFFHHWLLRFGSLSEKLYVICLSKGESSLPKNVKVFSLGKERGAGKVRQFINFQKYLFTNLGKVDGVFYHMCPEYAIASWPLVKLYNKKSILWFVHRSVNWRLKIAEKLVNKIYTSSAQSCRVKSDKIEIVGHGIDTDFFKPAVEIRSQKEIIVVGRISPIKDQLTLLRAAEKIYNAEPGFGYTFKLVGSPYIESDKDYYREVINFINKAGLDSRIKIVPSVPYTSMPEVFTKSSLLVNLCPTGGMDKVVLEAMACNLPVLVCNESFGPILKKENFFRCGDPADLAEKILYILTVLQANTREIIIRHYNLDNIILKIISYLNE